MTEPRYFHQSLIDPALTRDVARLRAEHGPVGLDLPEAASVRLDNEIWTRLRNSRLVLHYDEQGRGRIVAYEQVAIADQDPDAGWGDQA